ncbi:hypothetical protein [Halomonas caseinilytica]|uniref:Uncharacterized protein n=1 Tax=Halomonas caseinilytica TaxID=438744 RepID=A0A1M6ZPM0_9GAMM|nr:hypothetical protein [Halomonas caseinilytica]SEN24851.1 hypothetical protein SAMN04487952_11244 [Halomonas caseinilytica]SHL32339.1 hypothetical protein SAMN05192556_11144 [Halomonas caseinilytica]
MFGLPASTTWLVIGVPVFWILYTLGFLWVTRGWPGLKQSGREE